MSGYFTLIQVISGRLFQVRSD